MSPRSVSTHSFPLHHFYFYYLPFICWWKQCLLYTFPESRLPPSIITLSINMFLWPPTSPICWSLHIHTWLDSHWMYSKYQHRCCWAILSVSGGNKCLMLSLFLCMWNEHHWWSLYRFIISLDIALCWYSQAMLS